MFDYDVESLEEDIQTFFHPKKIESIVDRAENIYESLMNDDKEKNLHEAHEMNELESDFLQVKDNLMKLQNTLARSKKSLNHMSKYIHTLYQESQKYNKSLVRSGHANDSLLFLNERRLKSFCHHLESKPLDNENITSLSILVSMKTNLNLKALDPRYGVSPEEFLKIREKTLPIVDSCLREMIKKTHHYFKATIVPDNIFRELENPSNLRLLSFLAAVEPKLHEATLKLFCAVFVAHLTSNFQKRFEETINLTYFDDMSTVFGGINFESSFFHNSDFDVGLQTISSFDQRNHLNQQELLDVRREMINFLRTYLAHEQYQDSSECFGLFKNRHSSCEYRFLFLWDIFVKGLARGAEKLVKLVRDESILAVLVTKLGDLVYDKLTDIFPFNSWNALLLSHSLVQHQEKDFGADKIILATTERIRRGLLELFQDHATRISKELSSTGPPENMQDITVATKFEKMFQALFISMHETNLLSALESICTSLFNDSITAKIERARNSKTLKNEKNEYIYLLNNMSLEPPEFAQTYSSKLQITVENYVERELRDIFPVLISFVKECEGNRSSVSLAAVETVIDKFNLCWQANFKLLQTTIDTFIIFHKDALLKQCLTQLFLYLSRLKILINDEEVAKKLPTIADMKRFLSI